MGSNCKNSFELKHEGKFPGGKGSRRVNWRRIRKLRLQGPGTTHRIWMIAERTLGTITRVTVDVLKGLHTDGFVPCLVFRPSETETAGLGKGGWKL